MKDILLDLVREMVDYPDHARVTETIHGGLKVLAIHVHQDDVGKVIGKQGRIASGLRSVMTAIASVRGERVALEVIDEA